MEKTILMGLIVGVSATIAMAIAGAISAAYADHKDDHENADDKNSPTFPGTGQMNNPPDQAYNENAQENTFENCDKHDDSGKGSPAQCYSGDGK